MKERQEAAIASGLAASLGTLAGLHYKLKERLAVAVAGLMFETRIEGETRAPQVLDSLLPPKTDADTENYPFLLVRHRSGNDTVQGVDQNATATVEIVVGTLSDTDDGYLDLLAVIDAVRADLGSQPAIEGTAYEHVGPLAWQVSDQQARPQWIGTITTNWQLPRPQRRDAAEG